VSTATGAADQPVAPTPGESAASAAGSATEGETGVTDGEDGAGEQVPGITVVPAVFKLVDFDAQAIAEMVGSLCRLIDLPTDPPIRIEVDETTPLGRIWLTSVEPAVLTVESGALEDPRRPRQLSPRVALDSLSRLLVRLRDRRDPAFGDPPAENDLTLAQVTAWEVYAMGRLGRLGQVVQPPRWQYHFRVRHGFSDRGDAVFTQIWESDDLTWSDLERLSAEANTIG
jgi:hypothetical protein